MIALVSYGGSGYTNLTGLNHRINSGDKYRHAFPHQVPVEIPVGFWFNDPRWACLSHIRRKHPGGLPWPHKGGFVFADMLEAGEDWLGISDMWFAWRNADHDVTWLPSYLTEATVAGVELTIPKFDPTTRKSEATPEVWARLTEIYQPLLLDQSLVTRCDK